MQMKITPSIVPQNEHFHVTECPIVYKKLFPATHIVYDRKVKRLIIRLHRLHKMKKIKVRSYHSIVIPISANYRKVNSSCHPERQCDLMAIAA